MIADMLGRAGLLVDQDEEYEVDMMIVLDRCEDHAANPWPAHAILTLVPTSSLLPPITSDTPFPPCTVRSVLMVEMADNLEELYSLLPGHFGLFHRAIKKTSYASILTETKSNYTVLSPFNQAWMAFASRVVSIQTLITYTHIHTHKDTKTHTHSAHTCAT